MLHLLKIDLKKLLDYRTFWIICGLYFFTLVAGAASGMEFLKWLARTIEGFGQSININRIPLYHFPDIWQNLAWSAGLLKLGLAIMVVTSITNEYTYRTIRQNIIDGLSREQFLISKILTNGLLSALSMVLIFLIALVAGLIYSPSFDFPISFQGIGFPESRDRLHRPAGATSRHRLLVPRSWPSPAANRSGFARCYERREAGPASCKRDAQRCNVARATLSRN